MKTSLWPPAVGVYFNLRFFRPSLRGYGAIPFVVLLDHSLKVERDEGASTFAHELVHQRQGWRYLWIGFWALYLFSAKWRKRFEDEAYKVGR